MMPTPDARPPGRRADELRGELRFLLGWDHSTAFDRRLQDRAIDAYRDAVAAEARAALLAGAPTVWVATDGPDGNGWPGSVTLFVGAPRWEEEWRAWCPPSDGAGTTLSRHLAVKLGVSPGTCVRYRIVSDPEETP